MHYSLLVLLPKQPDDAEHLHKMLHELLAPFWEELRIEEDEEGYPYNPQGKWDWWVLGGRWRGQFGVSDPNLGYQGDADVFGTPPVYEPYLDATTRGNVVSNPCNYIHGVLAEGVWRDGSPDMATRPALDMPERAEALRDWFDEANRQWREWINRFWPAIPSEQWLALVDYHS
jgi:hypothetical protein